MAEVMTPAAPYRSPAILAKENAIKDRLLKWNTSNQKSAQTKINKTKDTYAKSGKGKAMPAKAFTERYSTQVLKGADQGFTPSDYGEGRGAAIPYQIGNESKNVSAIYTPPKKAAIVKKLAAINKK